MAGVPGSRLLLLSPPGRHRHRVTDLIGRHGIASERVEFIEFQPRDKYLALYNRIDLGLDTFPYNGHTTSLDSFWMGVPVVTKIGRTAVGRAGWCQLSNLGLPELAAKSDEGFVSLAIELAGDSSRLSTLRAGLRDRLRQSPLCDGLRFARNIENVYRRVWRRWCEKGEARSAA
jgi:predicted O-linked N-acetylglucosamine transferase (SPINDLY family)